MSIEDNDTELGAHRDKKKRRVHKELLKKLQASFEDPHNVRKKEELHEYLDSLEEQGWSRAKCELLLVRASTKLRLDARSEEVIDAES